MPHLLLLTHRRCGTSGCWRPWWLDGLVLGALVPWCLATMVQVRADDIGSGSLGGLAVWLWRFVDGDGVDGALSQA